jgi:transposase
MGKDIFEMSQKELSRAHIIGKVLERSLTQKDAAQKLDLSDRQIRRLTVRVKAEGETGLIHRLRGRPCARRITEEIWQKVLELCRTVYNGFGPVFTCEKLLERDQIKISDETLRRRLIKESIWEPHRKARKHRKWRERKPCRGEMIQLDGSSHPWFDDRNKKCSLMGFIDDATSEKSGQFYEYEGTLPIFSELMRYIKENGVPMSVYVDRHSTYKSTANPTIEDQLEDRINLSQFERACKELGVKVIHAYSPQAKGRIERSFRTDQDRLVKDLRLAGVSTIKDGNRFLKSYWPKHNKRFAINPASDVDMHRPMPAGMDLNKILCIKTEHGVRNDFTIVHDKKLYQILSKICPRKVVVQERVSGRMLISANGRYLNYKAIKIRPVADLKPIVKSRFKIKKTVIHQSVYHPWRASFKQRIIPALKQEALAGV